MNTQIYSLFIILAITILFLVLDLIRIDLLALLCMLALGWTGILTPEELLRGFSSNAVFVMMAVMVMGRAIDKTGIMDHFSRFVLEKVGTDRQKIIAWISLAIGSISGFIQNIGAVALFLPGIITTARRAKIPAPALIMPIGFAAIIGGTLTMVGSGPMLLVNDILRGADLPPYSVFSVTPLGILLLSVSILYFFIRGEKLLYKHSKAGIGGSEQEQLINKLHLPNNISHFRIEKESPLTGKTPEESGIWQDRGVHVLGLMRGADIEYSPWRGTVFESGQEIALLGSPEDIQTFAREYKLLKQNPSQKFDALRDPNKSGFAEVIIPERSEMSGKTIRQYAIRKRYSVEPVVLFRKGDEIKGDISDQIVRAGDTMIVYGLWERINELKASIDFVVPGPLGSQEKIPAKAWVALFCFATSIALTLAGFPVSLSFFSGAVAMVLTRTITLQEMYEAIDWKVVFLIAGLIPLGLAMQKTGAAVFLAEKVFSLVSGKHTILLTITVALLATIFSLVISNVGAMVVLAPIVIEIARIGNADPRPLVLLAAICTSNSFILPTHQVNAFVMSAGGYRNADYLKTGAGLTLLFLILVIAYFSIVSV